MQKNNYETHHPPYGTFLQWEATRMTLTMAYLNNSTREGNSCDSDACESLSENLAMIYLSFQIVEILRDVPLCLSSQ